MKENRSMLREFFLVDIWEVEGNRVIVRREYDGSNLRDEKGSRGIPKNLGNLSNVLGVFNTRARKL